MREYVTPVADSTRWENFVHRPGDIVVDTPAKCGTTWMQTIVNSLLFPDGDSPGPVFEISPWLEMLLYPIDEILERLERQTHRRSIKSHTPADGIPWFTDVKYIVVGRDPRDAFMSWVNHKNAMRRDVFEFMPPQEDTHAILPGWLAGADVFKHIGTFWEKKAEPNLLFVHYNDMKADLDGEMRRVATFLDIDIPADKWSAVVERCTFEAMKARPDEIGDFASMFEGGAESFLYKGTNNRWRDVLSDEELAGFATRAAELLPPDAVAWLERGRR